MSKSQTVSRKYKFRNPDGLYFATFMQSTSRG